MEYFRIIYSTFFFFHLGCVFLPQDGSAARILSVSFMSSKSNKITYEPLLEALAAKGHDVTVLSPIPAKKSIKNMREILTIDSEKMIATMPNMFELKEKGEELSITVMFPHLEQLCRDSLDLPQVKALQNETFDLVFVPVLVNECAAAYAYTFNTSMILISPISVPACASALYGSPSPPAFVPNIISGYTDRMNFYERLINFSLEVAMRIGMDFFMKPPMEAIYREKLNLSSLPSANEITRSTSLILSNSHFSIATVRPFLPDIIEVGGMHCRPAQPLPKDLEDFVNKSGSDGFILFSMGSALKGSLMSEDKRKAILSVFSKLKQKVLWKWETEEMADLPKNVKLSKWLPQQDVLGHPKIKAFITHGGFGSTTEAVYHGVPLVGIPMFGDQTMNMDKAVKAGYAVMLDFSDVTEETLSEAINKVLNQPKYKESVSSLSSIFRDQPNSPLDRAVFWTEYVIRHKGASHLRSSARNLNLFQYHSVDVIGLLAAILLLLIVIAFSVLKFTLKLFYRFFLSKSESNVKHQKKNK